MLEQKNFEERYKKAIIRQENEKNKLIKDEEKEIFNSNKKLLKIMKNKNNAKFIENYVASYGNEPIKNLRDIKKEQKKKDNLDRLENIRITKEEISKKLEYLISDEKLRIKEAIRKERELNFEEISKNKIELKKLKSEETLLNYKLNRNHKQEISKNSNYTLYRNQVTRFTKKNDLTKLVNYNKKNYHLDHKITVWFGFYNNIEPSQIADIRNLQYISKLENQNKSYFSLVDNENNFIIQDNTIYSEFLDTILDSDYNKKINYSKIEHKYKKRRFK
jgi:hypothetical protein